MKAIEVFENTLKLLGYSDANGNAQLTQRIRNRAVVAINAVYSDLFRIEGQGEFKAIKSLDEELELPQNVLTDIFPFGLAMFIAQNENDGDQQQFYASLYNSKRTLLTKHGLIKDRLPKVWDM